MRAVALVVLAAALAAARGCDCPASKTIVGPEAVVALSSESASLDGCEVCEWVFVYRGEPAVGRVRLEAEIDGRITVSGALDEYPIATFAPEDLLRLGTVYSNTGVLRVTLDQLRSTTGYLNLAVEALEAPPVYGGEDGFEIGPDGLPVVVAGREGDGRDHVVVEPTAEEMYEAEQQHIAQRRAEAEERFARLRAQAHEIAEARRLANKKRLEEARAQAQEE